MFQLCAKDQQEVALYFPKITKVFQYLFNCQSNVDNLKNKYGRYCALTDLYINIYFFIITLFVPPQATRLSELSADFE